MALSLDGFEVMRRLGENEQLFRVLRADLAEAAEQLVRKQLNSQGVDLAGFKSIVEALGEDNVELVLQTMDPADLGILLERLAAGTARGDARKQPPEVRRLLKTARERTAPPIAPQRRTLSQALKPINFIPLQTLSMVRRSDD